MLKFDFASELIGWYEESKRDLPWRKTTDPYRIWVSEIMLQQTRVEAVKPYYERFLDALPTITHLAQADDELLCKLWQGLGYYVRVRNMKKAAIVCVKKYGGKLPDNYAELKKLCGIGEYTAGAIASFAFGQAVPAVDGNVLRVMARYLNIETPIEEKAARDRIRVFLMKNIPKNDPATFDQALIELGATLCGPDRAARCGGCPLLPECAAYRTGKTDLLPVRTQKAEKRIEARTPLILLFEDKVCLVKRPPKGLLAGLWEPPTLEGRKSEEEVRAYLQKQRCEIEKLTLLPHARHIFTHIVWEMDGYLALLSSGGDLPFYTKEERALLALPSAFKPYGRYL